MGNSKIEWTHQTDNVFVVADESFEKQHGWWCQKVSPGCQHCYAERLNQSTFYKGNQRRYRLDEKPDHFLIRHDIMDSWRRQTKPKMHFINSMTDTFGDWYDDSWIFFLFDAMVAAPKQTFQILTKRSKRMVELSRRWLETTDYTVIPSNIWMMVSAEDQERADERVSDLIHVPAAVRGISAEPLLGPINFHFDGTAPKSATTAYIPVGDMIHWVIVGGESGTKARPMHPDWARDIRDQCVDASVPFFFKQWGEWVDYSNLAPEPFETVRDGGYIPSMTILDDSTPIYRFGKHKNGRLLDGVEWNQIPR